MDPVWIAIRFTQPQRVHILKQVINLLRIHSTAATMFNLCCVSVDLVRSSAGLPSAGEISEASKVIRSHLTCQRSCPFPVRGSAGGK